MGEINPSAADAAPPFSKGGTCIVPLAKGGCHEVTGGFLLLLFPIPCTIYANRQPVAQGEQYCLELRMLVNPVDIFLQAADHCPATAR